MSGKIFAVIISIIFLVTLVLVLWFGAPTSEYLGSDKIEVAVTIYPVQAFVEAVGGDLVVVNNPVPAGAEPHDFEPSPRDLIVVLRSDLLVYLGGGLDIWAEDMAAEVEAGGAVVLGIEDKLEFVTAAESSITKGDEHDHAHTGTDPHVWLDPTLAGDMVNAIRDALTEVAPEHAATFAANADAYAAELETLDQEFETSLARCRLDDIMVSHDAFGYLARRYDFNVHAIAGLSPDAEPSVRDFAALVEEAEELGVNTIFFETLASPALAETLAKEIGVKTAVLNPLEGLSAAELEAGENYLSIMHKNRLALSQALICR